MAIKIGILVIFIAIMVGIGVYCRKRAKSLNDFVLGGRNVGPWLTAFAYGTSYFSAVVFVGYAGQFGWNFGLASTWIGIGNAVIGSLLAWVVLGRRTMKMTKHYGATTMPEFFEKRYLSSGMKIVASAIVFLFLIPYSASVYKGLSGLFSMAFGIDFTYCVIGMAVLTALYVILGGYMATAVNDLIQGVIMIVGIIAIILTVLGQKGGIAEAVGLVAQLPNPDGNGTGVYASLFGPDPINLIGVIILTSLGTWGLPQMVHKFYTIKDERSIKTGTVISTVFALIIAGGSYFLGGFGRIFYSTNGAVVYDNIVPSMMESLPNLLMGVLIVMVLSASMSTLSSLVIASSSTFTIDFLKGYFVKNMDSKKQVLIIRILCALFILLSVVLALDTNPQNIITSLMSWSWGGLAGAFLGPFLYGLFWKGVTKAGVWAGFASGMLITITGFVIFFTKQNAVLFTGPLSVLNSPINIGALSMIVSLIIVPVVSWLTPKLKSSEIDAAFDAVTQK